MRIDFVRHGETPGNREKRYVGTTEEGLTPEAVKQARDMRLSQPGAVFVSPRKRCLQTAELLYPEVGRIVIPELAECDFGEFEYRNWQELSEDPRYQAWIDSGGVIGFPGGEDRETFVRRTVKGIRTAAACAEKRGEEHIAVVAHGGTIMAAFSALADPPADYYEMQVRNLEIVSACWRNDRLWRNLKK